MKPQIIAEIGINHGGDLWLAEKMIEQAKLCGADIVKFQSYDVNKLLNKDDFSIDDWKVIESSSNLRYEDLFRLRRVCMDVGIEFICSVFDPERSCWLEKLNVSKFKIASRSIYDKRLCEAILAMAKMEDKEVLVSMGLLDYKKEPICKTLKRFDKCKLLHCISMYPTPLHLTELNNKNIFDGSYKGFSDHTIDISASQVAIVYGAKYIEKHFTFDKGARGPDHKCSIEPSELKALCKFRDDFVEIKS